VAGSTVERGEAAAAADAVDGSEPPITDWALRPFAATRAAPLWTGAGIAAVFLVIFFGFRVDTSQAGPSVWRGPYFWLDVLNAVLLAYLPTATWMLRLGRLRDLRELRPVLRCNRAEFLALERRTVCVPKRRLAISGLIGALATAALPIFDPAFWEGSRPPLENPWMLFMIARHIAIGWLAGHAVATELTAATAFYEIGSSRLQVDLHDLRPLSPFARNGQRSAFAWVLLASLISLFWLGPGAGVSNGPILIMTLSAVSAGYFFSVYGPHRSIHSTKQQALDKLSAQIRSRGEQFLSGSDDAPPVSELVALHGFIAQLREWPIGVPALLRGSLIAALAIGGWLGGALVERFIELTLE
jgi:hypothetical protein